MSFPLYASADFTDSDAGTGDSSIENLAEFVKIDEAIKNLLLATTNKIEAGTDGYLNSIRGYRSTLQKLCCAENLSLLEQFCDKTKEDTTVLKVLELGNLLESEHFNPSSTDFFKNLLVDISGSNIEMNSELGCDYEVVEKAISSINELYLDSLEKLFQADKNLNFALEGIQHTFLKVNSMLSLETNDSSIELYGALAKYIHSTLGKYNLKILFDEFVKIRRKFIHYRILLKAKDVINIDTKPVCSICIDKEVSHALVGCGHTFCSDCVRKQIKICYICRCEIRERVKIYLG